MLSSLAIESFQTGWIIPFSFFQKNENRGGGGAANACSNTPSFFSSSHAARVIILNLFYKYVCLQLVLVSYIPGRSTCYQYTSYLDSGICINI